MRDGRGCGDSSKAEGLGQTTGGKNRDYQFQNFPGELTDERLATGL